VEDKKEGVGEREAGEELGVRGRWGRRCGGRGEEKGEVGRKGDEEARREGARGRWGGGEGGGAMKGRKRKGRG